MAATCFLYKWHRAGDHVHVKLSAGPDPDHRALCGRFSMRSAEWEDLVLILRPHRYVEMSYAGSRPTNEIVEDRGEEITRGDPTADNWGGEAGLLGSIPGPLPLVDGKEYG